MNREVHEAHTLEGPDPLLREAQVRVAWTEREASGVVRKVRASPELAGRVSGGERPNATEYHAGDACSDGVLPSQRAVPI